MERLPRGVVWLIALCVTVLAAAGVITWIAVRSVSAETLHQRVSSIVWLNVALQVMLLAIVGYIAARLLQSDRRRRAADARTRHLAELALLSGGLAHEIRNHLHALQSRVGLLRKNLGSDQVLSARVDKLDEIVRAMEQIVNDFLTFARPAEDELEQIDAATVIRSVADFESLDLDRANIRLELDLEPGVRLIADRRKLQRAILNLFVNARQAMPGGGTLRVQCAQTRNHVRIVVEDTGEGIAPADLPNVFDSYFTTKSEGTGLGLAIVRRTIEDCGGRVYCSSQVGHGTCFTIELPVARRRDAIVARGDKPLAVSPEGGAL